MNQLDDILALTSSFDIRVEALAAYIVSGYEAEDQEHALMQLLINPLGGDRRRTRRDVDAMRKRYFEADSVLQIDVNRKGLYDGLPERLFLRLDEDYEDARKRAKAITHQRAESRKFFLPFDQALYHPRIEIELKEQHYNERFPAFIETLWGLDAFHDCLNEKQRFLLCFLFPQAQYIVGDWNFIGLVFEAVLEKPVDLTFTEPQTFETPSAGKSTTELTLGEDAVLGDRFRDDLPALEITIKGITMNDLEDYLEGGKTRRLITELLCSYFLPLDLSYSLQLKVTESAMCFEIENAVLGVNVMLN